ncbi:MAG: hypothetical protein ABFC34_04785 [Methanobacterium sp.]
MSIIEMRVIPEPEEGTRAVFTTTSTEEDFVFMRLNGNNDYICSNCKRVLCKNAEKGDVSNIVFCCPKCKSYVELKGRIKYYNRKGATIKL